MILTFWLASCRLCWNACFLTIRDDGTSSRGHNLCVRAKGHQIKLLRLWGMKVTVTIMGLIVGLAATTCCGGLEVLHFVQILPSKLLECLTFILLLFLSQRADLSFIVLRRRSKFWSIFALDLQQTRLRGCGVCPTIEWLECKVFLNCRRNPWLKDQWRTSLTLKWFRNLC